ncbi:MAG: anhydro-N-acetylmuramic acid kinase [Alphaproteobacteria bacterium]|nr:anhydro-N-acetylmuramic acid kinase [Alphaproteobacteria bacterium]
MPPDQTTFTSLGLMSGTSMDGIDAALLRTNGDDIIEELGHFSIKYEPQTKALLKSAEYAIRGCKGDMTKAALRYSDYLDKYLLDELKIPSTEIKSRIKDLSYYLYSTPDQIITLGKVIEHSTELHGKVVMTFLNEMGLNALEINVVGYHGQAMYHQPDQKISVIIGDGQALANQTGIKVVNDFRSADVAAGGKGAPFAPLYHLALARRDKKIPVAVVNCGGIANITLILDDNPLHLVGFDTGPGNGLIDRLVKQRTSGAESMDEGGKYGSCGVVNEIAFEALCEKSILKDGKNYLLMPPPKALDIGDLQLVDELDSLSLEDACRTLEAFTAHTIVNSLDLSKLPTHWILAGGGWNNPIIEFELKNRLISLGVEEKNIQAADEAGWNNDALEAQIFAYLAVRGLKGKPFSFPGTTGVPEPMSGGTVYSPS